MERRRCVWPLCFSLALLFIDQTSENGQIFHESKLRWENNIYFWWKEDEPVFIADEGGL